VLCVFTGLKKTPNYQTAVGISMGLASTVEILATCLFIVLLWGGGCIRGKGGGGFVAAGVVAAASEDLP
jgi:hypothetical protein